MPPKLTGEPESIAWRIGDLAPIPSRPLRADLTASLAVALVLGQALVAQVTLLLATTLMLTGRLSRWRPAWLALPAASGLAWVLAIGVRPALAGYLAGAGHLVAHLTRPGARAAGPAGLGGALAGWRDWLPAQAPVAMLVAAAEAAVIGLLSRRDGGSQYRPGALVAARRLYLAWSTGRGELATADGGCVGITWSTGRRAAISWREAEGGVLCTGRDAAAVTATGLALTLAAIAHRKAVLAIDLDGAVSDLGRDGLADVIEAACAGAGAPLRRFGEPGGCYDPLAERLGDGAGQHASQHGASQHDTAELVLAMIDWADVDPASQRLCADYINAALIVIAATQAGRARPQTPVLDELTRLLQPGALRAGALDLSRRWPALAGLAGRVAELVGQPDAEPAAVAAVAAQLEALRAGALGRWLRGPVGDASISLRRALADREVVLVSLSADQGGQPASRGAPLPPSPRWQGTPLGARARGGRPAAMITRLALADLTAILAERAERGAPADCLVWVNGCDAAPPRQLTALIGRAAGCGAAVLLGTAADSAAAGLAGEVNVVAIRGNAPPSLGRPVPAPGQAGRAAHVRAEAAGTVATGGSRAWPITAGSDLDRPDQAPASPTGLQSRASLEMNDDSPLPAQLLAGRHVDALSLLVRGPRPRLLTGCRAVR